MVQISRQCLSLHTHAIYFGAPLFQLTGMEFLDTGKSFLEALILVSTNQQYDKRCLEHVVYINCSKCKNKDLPLHRKGTAGLKIYVYYILNHTLITCFATNLVDKKLSEGQSKVFSH